MDDGLVECAIAICYPDGILTSRELSSGEVLHTVRSFKERPPAHKVEWKASNLDQLVSVINQIPHQLGDPDNIALALSVSLEQAVARLSEKQKQDLAANLDLPAGNATKIGSYPSSRFNQAAKRAMLVIATAAMFHARLDDLCDELRPDEDNRYSPPEPFQDKWPPATASHCAESADPIGGFYAAWDLWLAVDYKPIFATARNALQSCTANSAFTAAVRGTARAAIKVTRNIAGLRHDLLGRIFHKVLDTARYDGSFYTTTAAATLLANLAIREDMCDWSDREVIANLRITDPACGTGTLLMAAAERIRDLSRSARNQEDISQFLIEEVLTGYDVNLTATHLAATTLGLLSPKTTFQNMKIGRALLGVENGKAYLGSLEFLSQDGLPQMLPWPTGVEQFETEQEISKAELADLVIMNPPFTRADIRHDQFSASEEKKLKQRENEIFGSIAGGINRAHNGGGFMALAEYLAKPDSGTVAVVLPTVGATNYSTRLMRIYWAEKLHIDTIITSHDPSRIYFSENTSIGEMLLICRRIHNKTENAATRVINLYENPATPAEAISVALAIIKGNNDRIRGTVQEWPRERIESGNWGAVQFLSPHLNERFIELGNGKFFASRQLGLLAEIGPAGRRIRDAFNKSISPDKGGMVALWEHKTQITQKMLANTDTYIVARESKRHLAEKYWSQRGTFLLANRARLNTVRCMSVRLSQKTVGSLWVPCRFLKRHLDVELLEKATCAYLNSTVGILAILGDRTNKIPSYPHFSLDDLRRVPVPDFNLLDEGQVTALATAYDTLCNFELLPLPQMEECETRKALDRTVTSALGVAPEIVASIRRELTREPSVTGKPYETA